MSLYSTPLKANSTSHSSNELSRRKLSNDGKNNNPFLDSKQTIETTNKVRKPSVAQSISTSNLDSSKYFNSQPMPLLRMPFGNLFGMVAPGRTENIEIKNMSEKSPLEIASQYIESLHELDNSTPILDMNSYYSNGVEYNYSKDIGGLGPLTPFERVKVLNIPDELLQKFEASKKSNNQHCGIFPEIDRCWFTIENKLVLWSMKQHNVFQTLDDDFEHDIVNVAIAKPHSNTFVHSIQHLLIVSTTRDMHLLAISYDQSSEDLKVFNTGLSLPLNGLQVNEVVSYKKTGQIFFTAKNDLNVWEFQYSNSNEWFNSKCSKACLTQSFISSFVPTGIISKLSSLFASDHTAETISKLVLDDTRGILYTLSSKNVIKAHVLSENKKGIEYTVAAYSHDISTKLRMNNNWRSPLFIGEYFKIVNIVPVSKEENNNLHLVAITAAGCRIYFTGGNSYGSTYYSTSSINLNKKINSLTIESVKFPPVTNEIVAEKMKKDISDRGKLMMANNVYSSFDSWNHKLQKSSSTLVSATDKATIISPGIFFAPVIKKDSKNPNKSPFKLYCSVPDYGILKNYSKYTENAAFLDTTGDVKCILPLTPLFNATKSQYGYANEFATQYTREPLQVAVLTGTNLEIYKYRTPDEVFESYIENKNIVPFVVNNGHAEACSTALFSACKFGKSEHMKGSALNFFLLGIPNVVDLRPTYNNRVMNNAFQTAVTASTLTSTIQSNGPSSIQGDNQNSFSLDNVILSPRFYGMSLLVSRLCRDIWNKPIFELSNNVEIVNGKIRELGIESQHGLLSKSDVSESPDKTLSAQSKTSSHSIISKISISKQELEYYISSLVVLEEFLNKYHDQIVYNKTSASPNSSSGVNGNNLNSSNLINSFPTSNPVTSANPIQNGKQEEICFQAENIGINSLLTLMKSIKEALSFLNVLYEESEVNGFEGQYLAFNDIIKYLSIDVQLKLSKLNFKDFFIGSNSIETKTLVREMSSSIINRNLLRGRSIDYITRALQERCGSFCSSNDVLGYRAVEHMKKAKEIGLKDLEVLNYHLRNATIYFAKICDDISFDKIKEACDIMLELNYYPKAIEFLLKMCQSIDKGNLAVQYVNDGKLEHDERKKYYDNRLLYYDLIFEILIKLDSQKVGINTNSEESVNKNIISSEVELEKLRKDSYDIIFKSDDKLFHYSLYDWLFEQKQQAKLLNIDTPFVLPYLQEHSVDSVEICNMLWVYQSKRSKFYEAALILYSLGTSDFDIKLNDRIEYLSRANGFSKSVCLPNERSKMIKLSSDIQEIFEIAEIQDEILKMVENDSRFAGEKNTQQREELINNLNNKILSVSDLFNDYAEPLEYYEICLLIFKASDFRVHEEIIRKWRQLFSSVKEEYSKTKSISLYGNLSNSTANQDLKYLLNNLIVLLGKRLYTNDVVFPIGALIQLIVEFFFDDISSTTTTITGNSNDELDSSGSKEFNSYQPGEIVDIFINCGVSYDKLYYILKNLIETNNSVIIIYKKEMIYLIKHWYKEDRNLRDVIEYEQIRSLPDIYEIEQDPISKYIKETGNCI